MIDTIQLRFHGILAKKTTVLDKIKTLNTGITDFVCYEHHELYTKMLKHKGRFFSRVEVKTKETNTVNFMDEAEFLHFQNSGDKSAFTHIQNVIHFVDESNIREMNMRITGKYSNPSSVSSVVYAINENGGFIDFTLSIPKYLYNHSLAEFVPQYNSERYVLTPNLESIKNQRKIIFKRLMKFLDRFINDLAQMFHLETLPNKNFIEIRRIDLCYNQHFKSKADALTCLEHQKKLVKQKNTNSNNKVETYETSLQYFTASGSYFKIYHKGTEYVSSKFGDFKKHQDYNQKFLDAYFKRIANTETGDYMNLDEYHRLQYIEKLKNRDYVLGLFESQLKGSEVIIDNDDLRKKANETAKLIKKIQPFKIHFLKDEMDKVLRYEISLRGDFFSVNYKKKVFRKNCPIYQQLQDNYKYVHSVLHSKSEPKPKISKPEYRDYKKLHAFYNKSIGLTLSDDPMFKQWLKSTTVNRNSQADNFNLKHNFYQYTILAEKDTGIFNDEFLQICFDYFFKTVKTFQPKKLDAYQDLAEKVKQYNEDVKQRKLRYDREYDFLTYDNTGRKLIKGNTLITKASQLLTLNEKRAKKLKPIQPLRIMQILNEMQKGKSLHLIRKELGISKSNFSKLKADLEMFGVYENTVQMELENIPDISYREYYWKTSGNDYADKFFNQDKQKRYG